MVVPYSMINGAFLALGVMTRSPEYLRALKEFPLVKHISVSGTKKRHGGPLSCTVMMQPYSCVYEQ